MGRGKNYAVYSDLGEVCHFNCCIICFYEVDRKTANVQHESV